MTGQSKSHTTFKKAAFAVWFFISAFYSLQMTLRILPSMMGDYLVQKFQFNASEFGMLAGIYYVGYAGMQVPIGIMLDRFHPRNVIVSCILIAVLGILVTIYTTDKSFLIISRFMIGVGSVAGILGAIKAIDDFFPKYYSTLLGSTVFLGVFGAFYGSGPIRNSMDSHGIEETLLRLIYIALGLCIVIFALYKKTHSEDKHKVPLRIMLKTSLFNKTTWIVSLLAGLMAGPMGGFADNWGRKYLREVKHLSLEDAALATSLIFFGLGLGSIIIGYISQSAKSLSKIVTSMGIMQIFVMMTLFYIEDKAAICFLTFIIGILSSYQVIVFALANKLSVNHTVGIVSSLVNSLIMFFCFIFNFAIGTILKKFFVSLSSVDLIYDQTAYVSAFGLILFSIFIGTVGFYIIIRKEGKTHIKEIL